MSVHVPPFLVSLVNSAGPGRQRSSVMVASQPQVWQRHPRSGRTSYLALTSNSLARLVQKSRPKATPWPISQ